MKTFSLLLLLIATCMSCFCADISEIPSFYLDPPNVRGIVLGLGTGESMEEAMSRAMQDVAVQLEVDVEVMTSLTENETTSDGGSQSTGEFQVASAQTARSILQNTKRLEHTVTRSGTYYVLVYYPFDSSFPVNESMILAEIRDKHQTNLVTTTILSVILPGAGQLMNRHYTKGSIMIAGAVGLLATSAVSFIGAQIDIVKSLQATTDLDEYRFKQQSRTEVAIGLVSLVLYAAEAAWSGIDNFSAQK